MVRVGRLRKRKVLRNRGVIHVPSDEDWAGLFREMEVEKPQHELPNSESVAVPELDTPRRNASQRLATQHDTTAFNALIDRTRESIDG